MAEFDSECTLEVVVMAVNNDAGVPSLNLITVTV